MKQVIIAGASGFIGGYISQCFEKDGWNVVPIGRSSHLNWNNKEDIIKALNKTEVVINLSGKSVNCVHNAVNKREIVASRVNTSNILGEAIAACNRPPKLWVNASGNAIYPRTISPALTEKDAIGDDTFMFEVCEAWEAALYNHNLTETRRIAFRTGIVLEKNGGILLQLSKLAKMGMGGTSGSGKQMMSWIHIEDYYRILQFVIANENIEGPINVCAPNPENNITFMQLLRKVLGIKIGLPAPSFAVKIGARLMGTEGSLALDSYNTISSILPKSGFEFKYKKLNSSLEKIFLED